MPKEGYARIISRIYDAAAAPERWPPVLKSIMEVSGAAGACYLLLDKTTSRIDWVALLGPLSELKSDYVARYASYSPLIPLVERGAIGRWMQLTKSVPASELRGNPWYDEFVRKSNVDEIYAMRLFDSATHHALFGVHRGISRRGAVRVSALRALVGPLSQAARLHGTLRAADRRSALALNALDQMTAGIVITDGEARVVEINRAAEAMVAANDGLTIRNGRVVTERSSENMKLNQMIAAAAERTIGGLGRLLVRKRGGPASYALTVAPVNADLGLFGRPMAMIAIVDPDDSAPSEAELAELYGLSPAESRLGAALSAGKTLSEIADESGVRITTLRTQLSSVLRKVGVERQADLARVLSRVHVTGR